MDLIARRERVKALLLQGKSAREIADEVGVSVTTIYRARSRMGSRKGNRAAYHVISTRVTDHENAVLNRLARAGIARTSGGVMRKLVRAAGGYFTPNAEEEAFLREALMHMQKLGGNFNQLAMDLSISVKKTGDPNPYENQEELMRSAKDEVHQIIKVVTAMLNNQQVLSTTLVRRLAADDLSELDDE